MAEYIGVIIIAALIWAYFKLITDYMNRATIFNGAATNDRKKVGDVFYTISASLIAWLITLSCFNGSIVDSLGVMPNGALGLLFGFFALITTFLFLVEIVLLITERF